MSPEGLAAGDVGIAGEEETPGVIPGLSGVIDADAAGPGDVLGGKAVVQQIYFHASIINSILFSIDLFS